MIKKPIKNIALDLEGTLISDAESQHPRPGLWPFLEFCRQSFVRILLFTAVSEERARPIIKTLVEQGSAPPWFYDELEYVNWNRSSRYKDLNIIKNADPEETLIVDDIEAYIDPDQKSQWISIKAFHDPRNTPDDRELGRIQNIISNCCLKIS